MQLIVTCPLSKLVLDGVHPCLLPLVLVLPTLHVSFGIRQWCKCVVWRVYNINE